MLKKNAKVVAHDRLEGHRVEITIRVTSRNGLTRDEVASAARRLAKDAARSIGDAPYINLDLVDTRIEF